MLRSTGREYTRLNLKLDLARVTKEAGGLMEAVEPLEVEVAAIHHVEGARLGNEHVEDVDIVQFAVGDVDEARDSAAQVEERVQFHRRFGFAKLGPWKQRQAQVDGGGIQGVDRLGEIHCKRLLSIQPACGADKGMGELGINAPVARLVGVGQGAAAHFATQPQVIEFGGCAPRHASMSRRLSR